MVGALPYPGLGLQPGFGMSTWWSWGGVRAGSVVPMSRVLVTGMSGTGKSSALAELGRRGYRVVDTGDPGWREYREYVESSDELHRGEWLWVEEKMADLLDSDDGRSLFVEGA